MAPFVLWETIGCLVAERSTQQKAHSVLAEKRPLIFSGQICSRKESKPDARNVHRGNGKLR